MLVSCIAWLDVGRCRALDVEPNDSGIICDVATPRHGTITLEKTRARSPRIAQKTAHGKSVCHLAC